MKTILKLIECGFAIMFLGIFMVPSFERFFDLHVGSLSYLGEMFEKIGIILSLIWLILQIVMLILQRSGMSSRSTSGRTGGGGRPGGTAPTGGGTASGGGRTP